MKNVLVLMDFSKEGNNALKYAMELVQKLKGTLFIQHVTTPEKNNNGENKLGESDNYFFSQVKSNFPAEFPCTVHWLLGKGDFVDEVTKVIDEKNIHIVIMGMRGYGSWNNILGTRVHELINNLEIPVILIPPNVKFKPVQKIILICDYSFQIANSHLKSLVDFGNTFNAEIRILKVNRGEEKQYQGPLVLDYYLKAKENALFFPNGHDLRESLNNYFLQNKTDLVATFPSQFSHFKELYNQPLENLQKFQDELPLFTLNNK